MGQSDIKIIQQKQAEQIVHVILNHLAETIDYGLTPNAEESEKLSDLVQRVLNPEFEEVRDDFESSNLDGIAYDEVSAVLQIDFNTGSRYQYFGVEADKAEKLFEAESKGRFFSKEIRNNYPYAQLT